MNTEYCDAVANGTVFISFPDIVLPLVGRDRECLYKSAPSTIRFSVLHDGFNVLLHYHSRPGFVTGGREETMHKFNFAFVQNNVQLF